MAHDPYAVLGVDSSASPGEITSAYRRLVRTLHPDMCPGRPAAHERLGEVVAAYRELHDPASRAAYDTRTGRADPVRPPRVGRPFAGGPPLVADPVLDPPLRVGPVRVGPLGGGLRA